MGKSNRRKTYSIVIIFLEEYNQLNLMERLTIIDSRYITVKPTDSLGNMMRQSHRIQIESLEPIRKRDHMARPYPASDFDFLGINVPSTYQQGLIPDGEEPPWGMLRVVATARETYGLNAGVLDAHRLRLQPEEIGDQIGKTGTKIVGLNPTSVNVAEAQAIAEVCDRLGIPYILGGIHATLDTNIAWSDFPNASAVVRGNGEYAIGPLLRGLLRGKEASLSGVSYPSLADKNEEYAVKMNPGAVPMVRQDELVEEPVYEHTVTKDGSEISIKEATLFVTDGCPFECSFCSSPVMVNRDGKGSIPYARPEIVRIVDEIEHAVSDLGADAIHFLDDMAFVTQNHISDLHAELERRDLLGKFIWRGLTRAPVIDRFSPETLSLMKESGAWKIALGVESGDEEMLKQIKKKVTVPEVISAVRKLAAYGIQAKGFFIMGFPGESEEQILSTQQLAWQLRDEGMTEIAVFQFKPYPGTKDYQRVFETMPDVIPQLHYLRRSSTGLSGKAQFRVEQHDTWLPLDLRIAQVPSGRVQELVTQTIEDFYGTTVYESKDSSCL